MSLANDIVLADRTPTNRTFSLQSRNNLRAGRIDTSTNIVEPRTLVVDHTREGKAGSLTERDRHLLQITHVRKDVNGVPHSLVMNVTLSQERQGSHTRADIDDMVAFIRNFLGTSANVDEWATRNGS